MPPLFTAVRFLALIGLCTPTAFAHERELTAGRLPTPDQARAAIVSLTPTPASAQRNFWLARAHLTLGNAEEAAKLLASIPSTHELYPYAAKQRLYLAQQDGPQALSQLLDELAHSPHLSTQRLALLLQLDAALETESRAEAEALFQSLSTMTLSEEESITLALKRIDLLRLQGKYQEALHYGRQLESGEMGQISAELRARIRLKLADVYFSQAHASRGDTRDRARGRAEETLLGFISSHPESPLIRDAFRTLDQHQVFQESVQARSRLEDWIKPEQLNKSTRAVHALKSLLLLSAPEQREPNLSYVNTALSAFPQHSASQDILIETTRRLLALGDDTRAQQYLKLIDKHSPYRHFFEAQLLARSGSPNRAIDLFTQAAKADSDLRDRALINAVLCALQSEQEEQAHAISQEITTPEARVTLLSNLASYYIYRHPQRATELLHELLQQYPDSSECINAQMDLAQLKLDREPAASKAILDKLEHAGTTTWTEPQLERFYALRIQSAKHLYARQQAQIATGAASASQQQPPVENPIDTLESALERSPSKKIKGYLTLMLGEALYEQKEYRSALKVYEDYAHDATYTEHRALAYLHAARCSEALATLEGLKQAIDFYLESSKITSPYHTEALIAAATLYIRIGKEADARHLITPLLKSSNTPPEQRSLLHTLMAQAWAYEAISKPSLVPLVLEHSSAMLDSEELSEPWRTRARLHHAHLCGRFGQRYEAIENYSQVIDSLQRKPQLNQGEWYLFYHAANAQIMHQLQLTQYRNAARRADALADWVAQYLNSAPKTQLNEQVKEIISRLRQRATRIRQRHFLIADPSI